MSLVSPKAVLKMVTKGSWVSSWRQVFVVGRYSLLPTEYYSDRKNELNNTYTRRLPVSRAACSLHLISSVGQSENEEKNAAKKPAVALPSGVSE